MQPCIELFIFQIEDLFSTGDYLGWSEVSARQNVMVDDAVRYV